MKFKKYILKIKIIECNSFLSRLKGFMFKRNIIDYGLLFKNCNSIHTFFMFQPIDIIMTNDKNDILYTLENVKPYKLILPKKGVKYIYELPLGSIKKIKQR